MAKTNAAPEPEVVHEALTEEELTAAVDAAFAEPELPLAPPAEDPLVLLFNRLEASFDARFEALERKSELLALKAVDAALPRAMTVAAQVQAAAAANQAPKVMRANVYDNFIGSPGQTPQMGHFRCERARAHKIQEFDMERMEAYKSGEIEWPKDKVGRRISLQSLCKMDGEYIPALDGHIYPTTPNQVACLLWYKTLPRELGGMSDLYEDTSTVPFTCAVCKDSNDTWTTREGWAKHMEAVHGEIVAAA